MPYITGKTGQFQISTVMLGGLREWSAEVRETAATDNAGQGDDWDSSVHLRNGWTAKATLELPTEDYSTYMGSVGDQVDMAGKIESGAAEDFFAGTMRLTRAGVAVPFDGKVTQEVEGVGVGEPTTIT